MAVSSVDDAPVASPLFLSMLEDAELFITLTTLTADVDTDTALNQDSGGLHTYSNAYGQALDVYIIDDVGEEGEDRGVLFQTSGVGGGGGLQQAEQINITRSFLESSSPPPSSFSTSSVLVSNPSSFSVLFKPAANAFSAEGEVYASFSFVVSDGRLNSSVAQVLISVTAVEDPPFFQPRTLRMLEDSSLTINPVSWAYDDPNEAGMDPNTLVSAIDGGGWEGGIRGYGHLFFPQCVSCDRTRLD